MPRDLDNPYGMEFRGRRDRGLKFVRPYRTIGELNNIEQWKLARHPFEVAQAVIETYSKQGPGSIATVPGEQERLKWVGMYPQRQGGDAFMLRIKVPGGVLTAPQVREIGVAADAYAEGPDDSPVFGNRYADLTTRQDVQLHWIRIADVPRIWQRFWDVGLTTVQACGDSARNVCSCPVSGIDANEVVEAYPVAQAISAYFTGNREYANLPRKWKIAVTGCTEDCARVEINDVALWPAEQGDGTLGFNVLVGGGLSDGERMASDIDVFIRPDQAVELCRGVAQVFGELGNRENRGLARMRYLVQELGPEGFRSALDERTTFTLEPAGRELTTAFRGDHVGVHPQTPARPVLCRLLRPGGEDARHRPDRAGAPGGDVRRWGGAHRHRPELHRVRRRRGAPGRPPGRAADADRTRPSPGRSSGASWPAPGRSSAALPSSRPRSVPSNGRGTLDAQLSDRRRRRRGRQGVIRMHFSGCSASCAQPQIADIGFRGDIAHVDEHIEEAVDIGLGGSLGPDAAFIDWVAGAMPVDQVPDALLRIVTRYREEHRADEPFHEWARRSEPDDLRSTLADAAAAVTS